ncbi:MAG: alcohol acetyltransferase, partial [Clostridia bacterium]|nr:alcohol acetyltransferase [Clostridia bacterium]
MEKTERKALSWVKLDNAAKIYPAVRRRNWSNVFRQSATLTEEIDKAVLSSALKIVVKRFPTIAARLRKGAFWYYLQEIDTPPEIIDEYSHPLTFMNRKEMRKCAFRVIVYKNRIAVEFFHSLSDGTGALVFLKNLVAEYLEQKYNISVPFEDGIVDRRQAPLAEEVEDSFFKFAASVSLPRKDTTAWHMSGEIEAGGYLNLTCFKLDVNEVLSKAHEYNSTVTVFLGAVMMK